MCGYACHTYLRNLITTTILGALILTSGIALILIKRTFSGEVLMLPGMGAFFLFLAFTMWRVNRQH